MKKLLTVLLVLLLSPLFCHAQNSALVAEYEQMAGQDGLRQLVSSLADDLNQGRECGTMGHFISQNAIVYNFRRTGLLPYNQYRWYTQSFKRDTMVFHNVAGMLRATRPSSKYIIVTAHYDHIGTINGRIYNGADDNASGVAMMITLARMLSKCQTKEKNLQKNIVFVATDGKEHNNAGAEYFAQHLRINPTQIECVINLDMLGTTLVPPKGARTKDYVIVLGDRWITNAQKSSLYSIEDRRHLSMYIDFTFYGSKRFTDMAYKMSDQVAFAARRIPSILFTSGFHDHTYKPSDDIGILDFEAMSKRTQLIFYFIRQMATTA